MAKRTEPETPEPSRRGDRASRRTARAERHLPDAPVRPGGYDSDDLIGESEFSAEQAGERVIYGNGRVPGGPPDRDPFTYTPDDDLARRRLEEATEAPAQDQYEPDPRGEADSELEFSGDDEAWGEEDLGPLEPEEEPDDAELVREERRGRS